MDDTGKLFKKLSKKERKQLLTFSDALQSEQSGLNIKKVAGTDFYRARKGRFCIIFHYEQKKIVIDSIRLRDEKTYRDL